MTQAVSPRELAATWDLQLPGRRKPRDIPDPIVEPDWGGMRVVVALAPDSVAMFARVAEVGLPAELAEALRGAFLAVDALVEGNLTTKALETGEGMMPPMPEAERPVLLIPRGPRTGVKDDPYLHAHERVKTEVAAERAVMDALRRGERHAFVATDLVWLDGQSLVDIPLLERKRLLETVLAESALVRVTAYVKASAVQTLITWGALGFAELSYRAANSRYLAGRENPDWAMMIPPKAPGGASSAGPR